MAFMAGMELMLAGWTIRNGVSYENMLGEEAQGAMSQFFGEGSGEALAESLESFGDPAGGWLDRCGIEIP